MGQQRVDRTAKEDSWQGGHHRHIAALCLSDGRRILKAQAITEIQLGRERYYTYAGGQVATVELVNACTRCASAYLRTTRDTTTLNNLVELPDCT